MFGHIFRFELRYWLRQPMVYVFLFINALLVFGAVSSDNVTIGQSFDNLMKNAPYVVENLYGFMSLIIILMVTAFVQSSALRDFNHDTAQIVFSTPLDKRAYLLGRFSGSALVSLVPVLGVTLGILVGAAMPWLDAERVGPVVWNAHLQGYLVFAIPNTFIIAVAIFAVATLSRSGIASFVAALALLMGYIASQTALASLDNEQVAMLLDPFAIGTFANLTKYWTVADRNTLVLGWEGVMLVNRLIWLGAAAFLLLGTLGVFSFSMERGGRRRKKAEPVADEDLAAVPALHGPLPTAALSFTRGTHWRQMWSQARIDLKGIVKSTPFIVILLFGLANMTQGLRQADTFYGLTAWPVTYQIIGIIRGTMYLFTVGILTFYSGELVWKERSARVDEIYDALPHPVWVTTVSKLVAMMGVLLSLQLLSMGFGVVSQALYGYTNFELGVYVKELLVLDLMAMGYLAVLSLLLHALVNNRYLGYFLFIVLLVVNAFIWGPLEVDSVMVRYGETPPYTYSDMNGFGPFVPGLVWFNVYWFLFGGLLLAASAVVWVRGKDTAWGKRGAIARLRFRGGARWMTAGVVVLWLASAGFVFYNTQVLNEYVPTKEGERRAVRYEEDYKALYEGMHQPRFITAAYEIDIYPEDRDLRVAGTLTMVNRGSDPIDSLFVNVPSELDMTLEIQRGTLAREDEELGVRFYALSPAMVPGDTLTFRFQGEYVTEGFENRVSFTQVVPNGTFFNNRAVTPALGYQPARELSSRNDRRDYDLPERERMPPLVRECGQDCMNTYLANDSDWVMVETVMSTSEDQIAVAPGSLREEWVEDGRRFFRYELDHPSLGFYSFISADYEVARGDWDGVDVEVYYHPAHTYNVDKMVNSVERSLDYFGSQFGPYRHRQARIIEFPRYASFAQAFPGTMPYSEGIGFIARIEDEDDIDMVFYVVAHEMAHQWWAHQVIGAGVERATLLSETMAQYSAIMVMEKEYGRDQIHKFLKYEMDNYLRSRGTETLKEKPLMRVDASQGYVHYRKGSVAMYYLKEMIGEDRVNAALRDLLATHGYSGPPFPTSYALVDRLRAQTPDSLQYLITDLFEEITLFDNRVVGDPTVTALEDGRYEVTLEVQTTKFRADSLGVETEIPMDDFVDIGVFARPEEGRERGATLAVERHRMDSGTDTFRIVVDEEPWEAGIDPSYFLIDRITDDNVKRVRGG